MLVLAGQRMCICHLPCRQMKSSQGLDQVSIKLRTLQKPVEQTRQKSLHPNAQRSSVAGSFERAKLGVLASALSPLSISVTLANHGGL